MRLPRRALLFITGDCFLVPWAAREFGMGSGGGPRRRLCGGSHEKSQNKDLRIPARGGVRRASVDGLPKLPSSSPAPTMGAGACETTGTAP